MPKIIVPISEETRKQIEYDIAHPEEFRKRLETCMKKYDHLIKPLEEAVRRTEHLTAKDYAVTINARDWH